MSVERLYYTDSYLIEFTASVSEVIDVGGRPAAILDRSAFYPTSGGQPFDTGTLDGTPVEEVIELEDGRVAHVIARPPAAGTVVAGRVDWPRRFDHMQQHTGQHILSAAFDRLHGVRTESFHLGSEVCTIDFAVALTPEVIVRAEQEANRIVWEDREVRVRFVEEAAAASLPLRKETIRTGPVRIVEVDGFDVSACGGTHVGRSGAVGMIAVAGSERFKGGTRLAFVCGGRALARFREQRDVIAGTVRQLSVLPVDLPSAIERLQHELKEQKHGIRTMQQRLAEHEAAALARNAVERHGRRMVVARVDGWDAQGLKMLAMATAALAGHLTVLVSGEAPPLVVIARGAGVEIDAAAVLRGLIGRFGGKGGGRPDLAQGGGLDASPDEIVRAAGEMLG